MCCTKLDAEHDTEEGCMIKPQSIYKKVLADIKHKSWACTQLIGKPKKDSEC